jgi:hypothetical protein
MLVEVPEFLLLCVETTRPLSYLDGEASEFALSMLAFAGLVEQQDDRYGEL